MKSFAEFKTELAQVFPKFAKDIEDFSVNETMKAHIGGGTALYSFQWQDCYMEYGFDGKWRNYFNGVWGEGADALEASESQTANYNEHINSL